MLRRVFPGFLVLTVVGCGGAGTSTTTAMPSVDPTAARGSSLGGGAGELVFKPAAGVNTPLGTLVALAPKSALAKAPEGKVDKDSATKLAKLGKEPVKLDDAYHYVVADATAPQANVGDKGATVPLPADAKPNPDGSIWVVDAETRRIYTLRDVKREADKPASVAEAPSGDLVHPSADAAVPPLGLVARADESSKGIPHALRILAKGVGAEGAPAEGARIRLKKGFSEKDVALLPKAILTALKKYGAVLGAGEGAPSLSALADPRWTKEDEKAFAALHMSDFEIIAPVTKPVSSTKSTK